MKIRLPNVALKYAGLAGVGCVRFVRTKFKRRNNKDGSFDRGKRSEFDRNPNGQKQYAYLKDKKIKWILEIC